jgi:hypothetical protein
MRRADRDYIAGHRFMYGTIGERVAQAAILFRDKLMRPGFVLPAVSVIRTPADSNTRRIAR